MDPNWRFGRRVEKGESSGSGSRTRARGQAPPPVQHRNIRPSFGSAEDEELHRLLHTRTMRVLTTNGAVVERPIDEYGGLSIDVPTAVHPPPVDVPNDIRFRKRTREDLSVHLMRGYRGLMSRNSFLKWPRSASEPPPPTVSRREDQRRLPRLDYTLATYDGRRKRTFFQPLVQYNATEDEYFKLDWNQSSFEGEAAELLKWPNMFVQRNKLEAKCHKYLLKVPKARSAQMMDGRRPNRLHDDVCERLQVEINAMCRRVIRQGLIVKKVREAERDGFDPRDCIRGIQRDPQYASDPEVSDYSDDCYE
ncbi:hypothetical protein RHMOL_Rhmol04G0123600 [Rhododendron molle]|uniref:Uncharacterized protein n=3 Tax=Rhododendron molle TaxID=49168 RepID=A0ACC0P1Q5_RHOML|nr:hypothetical protein RHMOL_Rhmol04G0123600 [Rhododendron molle]